MQRRRVVFAVLGALTLAAIAPAVHAELENQVFTSRPHRLRIVVPRGWRATDQPSYPGQLLWMQRDRPAGAMVVTAEPFTRQVYCSWPPECRASSEALPSKLACALRTKLTAQRLHVGPVQAGPKETEQAGMPSVWFELDDGKRFVRQAVAVREDRLISLVLSASSGEARSAHSRAFEQTLRTLRPLTREEMGEQAVTPIATLIDAGVGDASASAPADAGATAQATFAQATVEPTVEPVGPCVKTK